MMTANDLKTRTKSFAVNCINLTEQLPNSYLAIHIKKQLLRSSTSVAANYRAVNHAQTKASFISKLSIVIEESDECEFWLELLIDLNIITKVEVETILKEAHELTSIFIVSRKTAIHKLKESSIKKP